MAVSKFNNFYKNIEEFVFNYNTEMIIPCELGILLGGISMIPNRTDSAIKLYKDGKIKKILVSGGIGHFNINRHTSEAKMMSDYLIKNGIPKDDIIIEDKSRNTYENFLYCSKILKNKDFGNAFILITSDFHLKRCSLLFTKIFGNDFNLYHYPVYDGKTDKHSFKNSIYGKKEYFKNIYSY